MKYSPNALICLIIVLALIAAALFVGGQFWGSMPTAGQFWGSKALL